MVDRLRRLRLPAHSAAMASGSEGAFSIVVDGRAAPVCVVQTTWLKVQPFADVDARFARDYGEWDRTLATWRTKCWAFYADQCATLNRTPSRDMPLVCERFRVVYPRGS